MEIIVSIICGYILYKILFSEGKRRKSKTKRRPAFKKFYGLDQYQTIHQFEKKMTKGMFAENKEIYVTAFTNDSHVLRVTATIGSKYSCRASDNANLWGEKAIKIGATQIRRYHNHPAILGRSFPSRTDRTSHREIKSHVAQWGIGLKSFLVYKSRLGGSVIKKYH